MKKRLKAMFFSKTAIAFFTVLSAISALLFYSVRYGFVFVDDVLYTGFSLGLFVFTAIGAACLLAILNRKAQGKYFICEGATNAVAFLCEVLAVITFLYSIITIIVDKGMSLSTAYALFKSALPVWAFITGVAFFAFAFTIIWFAIVIVLLMFCYNICLPCHPLTPPLVRPAIKNLWLNKKRIKMGRIATTEPAIITL